jgi:hypothetical protein
MDLNSPRGKEELGFSAEDASKLARVQIYSLAAKPGNDASCLNLYQPGRPTILGVPEQFIRRGGFSFAAQAGLGPEERRNPWLLLNQRLPPDRDGVPRVPVILDDATAKYSLHLWQGVGESIELTDGLGRPVRLQIVALLKNSIFQGSLLIGQAHFEQHFPDVAGNRFFLIEGPAAGAQEIQTALEGQLGDYGLTVETTAARLARYLAVQNTYLSTFQTLGGVGLLLGTFGLGAVQLRNILERRKELAMLRAAGFRRRALSGLVLFENSLLLIGGLLAGIAAAMVALLPHVAAGGVGVPLKSLAIMLGLVLAVGLAVGLAAVRAALAAPLLPALRGE